MLYPENEHHPLVQRVVRTIFGSSAESPHRAGKPLRGELEGLYSAQRPVRVIYEVDDEQYAKMWGNWHAETLFWRWWDPHELCTH